MAAEFSAPATLTTPAGNVDFNDGPSGNFYITNIVGLDQAPIRAPVDDRPLADGGIVHNFYYGPRHLTLEGLAFGSSFADRNTATDALIDALNSILRQDGTWSWTPSEGGTSSLTVRCDVAVAFTGAGGLVKNFTFGLVAGDPTITSS